MTAPEAATPAAFVAALKRGDPLSAVAIANALVERDARLGDQWRAIARFAATAGEWTLALAAIARFRAFDPTDPVRILAHAELLAQAGRVAEAIAQVEPAAADNPNDASLRHFMGTVYIQTGETRLGIDHLDAALRVLPDAAPTWLAWANARSFAVGDGGIDRLVAAAGRAARAPAADRGPILYALGKAWDDLGETDRAFAAFADGARAIRAERAYDPAIDLSSAQAIVAAFPQSQLVALASPADSPARAIFVTGLPRSGTTLVEQMLVSHSAVAEGGELNILGLAAQRVGGVQGDRARADIAAGAPPIAAWHPFVAHYAHLLAERFGTAGHIVDKSLNTGRFAGLIGCALPAAPLIWLRRDPRDTAWSCFRTCFAGGVGWSFALDDLAQHFAVEDMLFAHWRATLGDRLLVIPYEQLVGDPERWIPAILAHCRLAVEPGVFDFHTTGRAVATASVAQVRRPLYLGAVGASARYAGHLAPFVEAYASARNALGLAD